MSQNSLTLPTSGVVSGLQMTQFTNNALDTLNTLAAGATAPASPEAGQLWHNTTNNTINIRSLDGTTWVPVISINEGVYQALPYLNAQVSGNVNRLINPGMDIDQVNEGASYSIPTNDSVTYGLDQWFAACQSSSASGITVQKVSDAPPGFKHSLKMTVGTGAGSVASGDFLQVVQPVEAQNIQDLNYGTSSAAPTSLSFWVKSSVAGTFAVALGNVSPRQLVSTFTVTSANTWQKVTIQNIVGDTGGSWGAGNALGLLLSFTVAAGTNFQTSTLNAWTGGYFLTGPSPSNGVLTTSGATFQIAGAQWNAGNFSLPYQKRTIQEELQLCQRYYEKTFLQGTAVAQNAGTGTGEVFIVSTNTNINTAFFTWQFSTKKRTSATIVTYNPSNTNSDWRDTTAGTDLSVTSLSAFDWCAGIAVGSSAAVQDNLRIHMTANARM